ncbi:MAG: hypothetical protein JNJ47_01405, partial [Alphaproteobacteria bacterium]|nr:hypothetical protein [Alphaproteobacteria bacterium]
MRNPFYGNEGIDRPRGLNSLEKAAIRIEKEIICPLWEQEKYFIDAALYEAHFKKSTYFVPFKGLGCSEAQGIYLKLTPFDCGSWKEDLPYPAFLQPTNHSAEVEELFFPTEPSVFETFPFEKLDDLEEEIFVPSPLEEESKSIEGSSRVADISGPSCLSDLPAPILSSFSSIPSYSSDLPPPIASSSISLPPSSSGFIIPSSSSYFIMPSGIRKFHELIPSSPYEARELKKKDQSFIDSVFNAREFKNITYGDFETFWIKQGGKVVGSHGGSHRLLVGPKGDSLSGTYTHGRGQTY